jgi:hypothetical protein
LEDFLTDALSAPHHTFMRLFTFALLSVLSAVPAFAQSSISNFLLEETVIHSGTGGQFESAQKDYCAAVVKGGAPACLIFSVSTFGPSDRYFTVLPFGSFIHYDQGKYTEKGLTHEEAKALSARRIPPIASNHESAVALHNDLSILAPNDTPLNYFTEYHLRPGTLDDFLAIIRKNMLPAARKSGVESFEVITTTLGESPDRVFIVTRLRNFASFDQPDPILANMSHVQRAAFQQSLTADVEHVETYVMRYRADLSTDTSMHSASQ